MPNNLDQRDLREPPPRPGLISRPIEPADPVRPRSAVRTAGGALLGWWRAATLDALLVGVLWLIGLELLHVPFAPLWASLGAIFQFIPSFGGMLAVIGPVLSVALSVKTEDDWYRLGYVLGLYAIIAVLDGLVIGPYILHRTTRIPWWAAFLGPIVLRPPDSAVGRAGRAAAAGGGLRLPQTQGPRLSLPAYPPRRYRVSATR